MTASNDNIIEEVKDRCSIVDVVGAVVPLKRAGSNHKGLCPFHGEKTPSFVVSEAKQIFTCFGCGATGDVIEFTKKYYNLEFMEAMEKLAKDYGITLPDRKGLGAKEKDSYYEINRMAARFFYDEFQKPGNPGQKYMEGRGIDNRVLRKFGIGYADGEWDSLLKYFEEEKIPTEKLLELGLISQSNGKKFDKYRDRVMFPIINTGGKVIGFGGRALGDNEPKYLNSQESLVFQKKNNVYGLNLTRTDIGRLNYGILVEGYMDVISLYQHGISNVGASLGTALTENQAHLLKRYTENVVLAYDSDSAGILAAIRGSEILYKEGLKSRVLNVSSGKDPDDFVREKGKEAFLNLVKTAPAYIEYRINILKSDFDMQSLEGRIEYLKAATQFLGGLTPVEADAYIGKLAQGTGISEGAIRRELSQGREDKKKGLKVISPNENPSNIQGTKENLGITMLEKNFLKLLLIREDFLEKIIPYEKALESKESRDLYHKIKTYLGQEASLDIKQLVDGMERSQSDLVYDLLDNVKLAGKEHQILEECIKTFELNEISKREKEIIDILDLADESLETEGDHKDHIRELEEELMEIQREKKGRG